MRIASIPLGFRINPHKIIINVLQLFDEMNSPETTSESEKPRLLIVGASTRAAACSALRAGWSPVCVDQFSDQDLLEIAEVIPQSDDPDSWLRVVNQLPPMKWIYTGGMENHPTLIRQISDRHELQGCAPTSLNRVRDPFYLERLLKQEPVQAAPCLHPGTSPDPQHRWLRKPLKSAGGRGIHFSHLAAPENRLRSDYYMQRYQAGFPCSALFLAFRDSTQLLGVFQQWTGSAIDCQAPFLFYGGMTVPVIPSEIRSQLEQLGETVATGGELTGLFGCDLIWETNPENRLWLTEVNPRYTALTELLELRFQAPILDWHLCACESFENSSGNLPTAETLKKQVLSLEKQDLPVLSKAVLYAFHDTTAPRTVSRWDACQEPFSIPEIGDIPNKGTRIPAGSPVCTVFGSGNSHQSSQHSLATAVSRCQRHFGLDAQPVSQIITQFSSGLQSENPLFFGFLSSANEMGSFLED